MFNDDRNNEIVLAGMKVEEDHTSSVSFQEQIGS